MTLFPDKIKTTGWIWGKTEDGYDEEEEKRKWIALEDVAAAVKELRGKVSKRKDDLERIKPVDGIHEDTITFSIFELMSFEDWITEFFGKEEK